MNKKFMLLIVMTFISIFFSGCVSEEFEPVTISEETITPEKTNDKESIQTKPESIIESITVEDPESIISNNFPQKFHTKGNKILNSEGKQVILRGVNALNPLAQVTWGEPMLGVWNEDYYKNMKIYGAEIVRVPIHPDTWRDNSDARLEILDQTIKWIGDQEMYVIIDYHSIGFTPTNKYETSAYKTSKEEIKEFWKIIAQRYKNDDVVAFYDIFNEPVNLERGQNYNEENSKEDWNLWKKDAEEIITVIRKIDEDSVIFVGGMNWAYDLSAVIDNPIEKKNIVYGVHPYPGKLDYLSWDDAFGKTFEKYPVFVGEIGFWNEKEIKKIQEGYKYDNDPETYNPVYFENSYSEGVYRKDIVNYLNEKEIGWTAWSFSPAWGPVLLLNWDYELSESGTFFKEQLGK